MFPFETDREDKPWLVALALAALVQSAIVFAMSFQMAGGHFMLPLDDSYIHLQYARQFASGAPLVYTEGAAPSGGMTSPLYVLLLAPLFVLGFEGVKGAFAAFLFGTALWMLLPVWVYQLVKRLTNCLCAAAAGALVLAHGHLLWNFLSGMETALFTILLVGAALGAAAWWQSERRHGRAMLIACLAMLPLTRPEGIIAIPAIAAIVLVRRGERPRLSLTLVLLCAVPFLLWLLTLKFATGEWRPAGLVVKGLLAFPYFNMAERLAFAGETLAAIPFKFYNNTIPDPAYAQFKGFDRMPYVAPGLGILAALGAGLALVGEWRLRRPAAGSLVALLWLLGLLSIAGSLFPFVHQQRYLAPWTVLAVVLAFIALWRIAQLFRQLDELFLKASALALILVTLPSLPWWMGEHGRNSRDIYHVLRAATFGLHGESTPIAITDAGTLAYYTDRQIYDLVGLTSPEFPHAVLHGEGATLAALAALPHSARPAELVTYREWFSPAFPVKDGVYISGVPSTSITSGVAVGRFPFDWKAVDLGRQAPMQSGDRLLFTLDVADLESEMQGGYRFRIGPYDANPHAWPEPLSPVEHFDIPPILYEDDATTWPLILREGGAGAAGGRTVRGESFRFVPPADFREQNVTLYLRAAKPRHANAPSPAADRLAVMVRSNTTGYAARREVLLPDVPAGEPLPSVLALDLADMLDEAGGTGWHVAVEAAEPPGAAWSSFGYWIVQTPQAID